MEDMLCFVPANRLRATDMLDYPWCANGDPARTAMLLDNSDLFSNIRTYQELSKFERIIVNLVASVADPDGNTEVSNRLHELRRMFRGLDVDHDGCISEEELVSGFHKFYKDDTIKKDRAGSEEIEEIARSVYAELDVDGSGTVDYTEFLAAGIGSAILMDEESISSAFRGLDSKQRNKIHKEDLMDAMGEEP